MAEQLCPRRIRGRIHHEMTSDGTGGDGGSHTVTIGTRTSEMVPKSEEKDEQLLPGILNDVTLNHIVTKLPWKALYILPLVSPSWQRAIQSCRVRDARVRSHSTETLVVHYHKFCGDSDFKTLAMFSMRDKRCYELPPIPLFDDGIPFHWKCISLDGKVYVVGWTEYRKGMARGGNQLYVLDLVGQRHWKQCASMPGQRYQFRCGAVNGKIYVFGGRDPETIVLLRSFEVYDPNMDAWSKIMPMPRFRVHYLVGVSGDELYVYGGACYKRNANRRLQICTQEAKFGDVYHLVKDSHRHPCLFVAYGQFYSMNGERICTYDFASNSWKDVHSNSLPAVGPIGSRLDPSSAVSINGELLALLFWFTSPGMGAYFIKSTGFGHKGSEVTWEIVSNCPNAWGHLMSSIQL